VAHLARVAVTKGNAALVLVVHDRARCVSGGVGFAIYAFGDDTMIVETAAVHSDLAVARIRFARVQGVAHAREHLATVSGVANAVSHSCPCFEAANARRPKERDTGLCVVCGAKAYDSAQLVFIEPGRRRLIIAMSLTGTYR
jgi:hypothetical protein